MPPGNASPPLPQSSPGLRARLKACLPSFGLKSRLKAYFLAGVLVMAPISITLYLTWLFVSSIDDWAEGLVPVRYNPEHYLPFSLPGIGLVIVLAVLTLIGLLTAGYVGRLPIRLGEAAVARVPFLRGLYGGIKQVLTAALDRQSPVFRSVVLVQYPRRGIWLIGFVTGATEGEIRERSGDELINVYVPKAPSPTRGFYQLIPRRELVVLSMSVEDGFKLLLSGGIVAPPAPDGDLKPRPQGPP